MRELTIIELSQVNGGSTGEAICHGIAVSSTILAAGAALNWWNPAGWVMTGGLIIGGVCEGYQVGTWIASKF
jgi:hypothetical protein